MKSPYIFDTLAAGVEHRTVFVAFELGKAKWKLGIVVPGLGKLSQYTVAGGDVAAVSELIGKARARAAKKLGEAARVVSCYEAGYDGFWLHRWLEAQGIESRVLDAASVEVDRRARRAKTDRLDLEKLMRALLRLEGGDRLACRAVHVPTAAQEDERRPSRERQRLVKERTSHVNRLKGLLHGQGVRQTWGRAKDFAAWLATLCTGDGRPLPDHLVAELRREHSRLLLVEEQLDEIEAQARAVRKVAPVSSMAARVNQLLELRSLGPVGSQILVGEAFFRDFQNRRQVGSYFGLTGTPYNSGDSRHEQGISKAGNARARTIAVQLAWLWLRNQPASALSRWFRERVGQQKGAGKRIAIVALARKLMVALWRFLHHGVVPDGAQLRAV
ncbi:IS110 family transposase [Reyranella sp.]|uniref:IS110 family transposase n=1 Tax=Reyranella sp. TaxID=1929291 RepID=UPI003BADAAD6